MFEDINYIYRELPEFFLLASFVFGACWGSFFNVVIYRIPAGKSVVFPGSHCSCGKPIAWHDNIPIFSWFVLRGKARCCGAKFSFQYPFVELLSGALFMACWWMNQDNLTVAVIGWLFIAMLICSTFIDLQHMILPDYFTVYGAGIGVVLAFCFPQLHEQVASDVWVLNAIRGAIDAAIGVVVGSAVIMWIALVAESILRKDAMGFGDVVFMGCIGAFCGWEGALFAIFGGAVLGTFVVFPMMILQRCGIHITPGKVENDAAKLAEPNAGEGAKQAPVASEKEASSAAMDNALHEDEVSAPTADQVANDDTLKIGSAIPFGPWLALGAAVYYIFLRDQVDAYFAQIVQVYHIQL